MARCKSLSVSSLLRAILSNKFRVINDRISVIWAVKIDELKRKNGTSNFRQIRAIGNTKNVSNATRSKYLLRGGGGNEASFSLGLTLINFYNKRNFLLHIVANFATVLNLNN